MDPGNYRPGDIVAAQGHFSDASGHSAIVTEVDAGGNITRSVYASDHGIKTSNWGSIDYKMSDPSRNHYYNWGGSRIEQ